MHACNALAYLKIKITVTFRRKFRWLCNDVYHTDKRKAHGWQEWLRNEIGY